MRSPSAATGVLLRGCVFRALGCQPEGEVIPAPTLPSPPPLPTPPEPPETRYLAPGFTGLYFIPGQPLVLAEGSSVFVDVNWVGGDVNWLGGDDFPPSPSSFQIVSDARASELSVTPSTVEFGPRARNASAIFLSAVVDGRAGEAPATYTLEVQPGGTLARGWAYDLSRAKMEITVVEAEPSAPDGDSSAYSCQETRLQALAQGEARESGSWMRSIHGDDLSDYVTSRVALRAVHPRTALSLLAPYRRPGAYREMEGDPPFYRPYPFGFLVDLALQETGDGFEQTMTLARFDDLHLRIETPGCDALEAVCTGATCRVR